MMPRLMNALLGSKFLARAGTTLALLAISSPVLWAQDAAEEAPLPTISLFDYIKMSGFVGWCICILSVVALAMILENIVTLRREKLAPPELVDEVKSLFDEGQYQDAMELCENDKSFFARVCAAGISKIGHNYEMIEHALQEAGNEEAIKLHQKVTWLSVVGALAPMLGLFGTVQGMIQAFQIIASTQNPSPAQLATGIYVALLTTFEGLMVAIPVITAFAWVRNRLVRAIIEVGAILEDMFEKFRPQ
ncbi:MAG TPA: MotA/TolQ/ExbB proton channel family protein [Planctomycetota bacterium]|nr:MotA/TolQ/ExbB proton channel family protein [Planctomycetota bacterium]